MNPKILLLSVITGLWALPASAQTKIGGNPATAPNASALLEMEATNKGMLLPRVALSSTTTAAPLSAHVKGMALYNTAAAGTGATAVTEGYYYNDGTKWVRLVNQNMISNALTAAPTDVLLSISPAGDVTKADGTGAVKVPVGNTAQRPVTAAPGLIRYNTTTNHFEGYNGVEWANMD